MKLFGCCLESDERSDEGAAPVQQHEQNHQQHDQQLHHEPKRADLSPLDILGHSIVSGKPGPRLSLPPGDVQLAPVDATVLSSMTGPDGGVQAIQSCAPSFRLAWDTGKDWAYGSSISMYDATITAGKPTRSGDPIADCFCILAYKGGGALLAVADGVSWGEPARRAARCAVLGATQHLHTMLKDNHLNQPSPKASAVFHEMMRAVHAAQTLILQQCGTLTTLVLTLVLRVQDSCMQGPGCWAALTLTVGDSAAYVYRASKGTVQELTHASHENCVRNVSTTFGALGHALGDDPDLANMTASTTLLHEGDMVFLASDGVSDNFNPAVLKLAKPLPPPKGAHAAVEGGSNWGLSSSGSLVVSRESCPSLNGLPAMDPAEMQAKSLELLQQAIKGVAAQPVEQVVSAQLPDRFVVSLDSDGDHSGRLQEGPEIDSASGPSGSVLLGGSKAYGGSWTSRHGREGGLEAPRDFLPVNDLSAPLGAPLRQEPAEDSGATRCLQLAQNSWRTGGMAGRKSLSSGQQAESGPSASNAQYSTPPSALPSIAERLINKPPSLHQRSATPPLTPPHSPRPAQPRAPRPVEPLNARVLVDGLLQHVYKVTEPLRLHTAAQASATRTADGRGRSMPTLPSTYLAASHPGKLDHATLVAFTVGDH